MNNTPAGNILDLGAFTVLLASLTQILPAIAAFLSIVWFSIRIAESVTVQQALGKYAWVKPGQFKRDD